tara:strand:+ start:186 stop:395 length:210 start_codon:yes stop_codon:yes gene_type:complete
VDQAVVVVIFYVAQQVKVEQEQLTKEMPEVMQDQVQIQVQLVVAVEVVLVVLVQMEVAALVVLEDQEQM